MNQAILHPLEEQREDSAGMFVADVLRRATERHQRTGWRMIAERAPENVTLELDLYPLSVGIVTGWCSFRFLRGHPTFWAWLPAASGRRAEGVSDAADQRAEIVFPRRWRVVTDGPAIPAGSPARLAWQRTAKDTVRCV